MVSSTLTRLRPRLIAPLLPRVVPLMRQWAEDTIIIPAGPCKGEPFRCDTQPFARLFLDEVDTGQWERIATTGPTQTGKSLICYVIPVLYHLFAVVETVAAGLPNLNIAQDKWAEDFLPVIEAAPALRELLPIRGEGSRGGVGQGFGRAGRGVVFFATVGREAVKSQVSRGATLSAR